MLRFLSSASCHYKMHFVSARANSIRSRCFIRPVREWFEPVVRGADAPAGARLAGDRARRVDADPRADRQRQNAHGVPLVPRSADVRAAARRRPALPRRSTSRRSRRWPSTSSGTCARRSPASPAWRRHAATPYRFAGDRHSHRRYAGGRARAFPARAGRHPDHDARIALPAADLERARGAARRRDDHHRRDPRAGADQARRAPRALASNGWRRAAQQPPQRIGLSATQRPLDEVARFLGGAENAPSAQRPRTRHERAGTPEPRSRTRDRGRIRRARRTPSATARSPSSMPARRRRCRCASKCRSRTWRG